VQLGEHSQRDEVGRRRRQCGLIYAPRIGDRLAEDRRHQVFHAKAMAQRGEDLRVLRQDRLPGFGRGLRRLQAIGRRRRAHREFARAEEARSNGTELVAVDDGRDGNRGRGADRGERGQHDRPAPADDTEQAEERRQEAHDPSDDEQPRVRTAGRR
jgi:hypothetical protein